MEKDKVVLVAIYRVKEGAMPAVIAAFGPMVQHTQLEDGNLIYQAYRSQEDPGKFIIYEEYANQRAVETHRNAPYFESIIQRQVLPLLESREVHRLLPLYTP